MQSLAQGNEQYKEDWNRRAAAAKGFIDANNSQAVRNAVLMKSRPKPEKCQVGEFVFYWREADKNKASSAHWRGPAVVCTIEPTESGAGVYWIVHGSALIRATHEQLRPELSEERWYRQKLDPYDEPVYNMTEQTRKYSKKTR